MRVRAVVAIGLVLIPSLASAQQRPRIRLGGQPPRVAGALPEGPAAIPVSQARRYYRLNVSMEAYPFVSRVSVPSHAGLPGETFTTGGTGTRFEYRFHGMAAGTLDLTTSFIGGPVMNQTAELGFRFGPSRARADVVPFIDARAGYLYSLPRQQLGGFVNDPPVNFATVMNFATGPAAIGGAGIEFAATRRFSVTTAAAYSRAFVTARPLVTWQSEPSHYTMTQMRYIVSLRYNGVRAMPPTVR